jgi:hypothetical protein
MSGVEVAESASLQGTIRALRDALEAAHEDARADQRRLEAERGEEIQQLRGTIIALREELEVEPQTAESAIRALERHGAAEVEHLRDAVVATREEAENHRLASRDAVAEVERSFDILISDFTLARLKGVYRTRKIDRVIVKGKTEPVAVHEVLDHHSDASFPNLMDVVNDFREGVASYREGDWDRAIGSFSRSLRANPLDALSAMYVERCERLKAQPPTDWDGVWAMTSK